MMTNRRGFLSFLKEQNFRLSFMILGGVLQCFGNFGATFSEAFPPQKRKNPDAFFDLTTAKKSIKVGFNIIFWCGIIYSLCR